MNYLLAVVVLSFSLLSCEREVKKNPLGPQVSPGAIDALQREYVSRFNPYSIQKGQSVYYAQTQEVITSQAPAKALSKEWVIDVVEVTNSEDLRTLTTIKKVNDRLLDENFTYEFKSVYYLPQIESLELLDQLNQNSFSNAVFVKKIASAQEEADELTVEGVAFHNLQTRIIQLSPPPLVQEDPNCRGLKDCKIDANLITYDVVFLMSDGSSQKTNVEWHTSTQVPFFAGILKQCATSLIPIENSRVLVKQCSEVVNFNP